MKKSLKVAALGVAAFAAIAPVAGVFAVEGDGIMKHEDELTINILPVCTLGTLDATGKVKQYATPVSDNATSETAAVAADDNTSHTAANGTWTNGTTVEGSNIAGFRTDEFAFTMQPGTKNEAIATTTFNIHCNSKGGYTLSAIGNGVSGHATQLYDTTTEKYIPTNAGEPTGTGSKSFWAMKVAANGPTASTDFTNLAQVPSVSTAIATKNSVGDMSAGETVTVTYGIGVDQNQEAGSYTGAVLYTLAQK